jgi:hypothetical protein
MAHGHGTSARAGYQEIFFLVALPDDSQEFRSAIGGAQPQLVSATEHNGITLPDPFQVIILIRVVAIADMHHIHIRTADLTKGVEVVFTDFIRDHRSGSYYFDPGGGATGFFYHPPKYAQFKEV